MDNEVEAAATRDVKRYKRDSTLGAGLGFSALGIGLVACLLSGDPYPYYISLCLSGSLMGAREMERRFLANDIQSSLDEDNLTSEQMRSFNRGA